MALVVESRVAERLTAASYTQPKRSSKVSFGVVTERSGLRYTTVRRPNVGVEGLVLTKNNGDPTIPLVTKLPNELRMPIEYGFQSCSRSRAFHASVRDSPLHFCNATGMPESNKGSRTRFCGVFGPRQHGGSASVCKIYRSEPRNKCGSRCPGRISASRGQVRSEDRLRLGFQRISQWFRRESAYASLVR